MTKATQKNSNLSQPITDIWQVFNLKFKFKIAGQTLTATSFVADFDRPDGSTNASPTATRLEGNVASGDSGGGVFVTVNGIRYLAGISSYTGRFGPGAASSYGSISGATNLDLFHSWIFDQTGIASVPEPGSLWFCGLGSLVILRRRR